MDNFEFACCYYECWDYLVCVVTDVQFFVEAFARWHRHGQLIMVFIRQKT